MPCSGCFLTPFFSLESEPLFLSQKRGLFLHDPSPVSTMYVTYMLQVLLLYQILHQLLLCRVHDVSDSMANDQRALVSAFMQYQV